MYYANKYYPEDLKIGAAFKDVVSAREDREKMINDAEGYRNSWHDYALDNNFISVVPEFKSSIFPKDTFNWGNIRSLRGRPIEQQHWLLSVIEPIFDKVKTQLKMQSNLD